MPKHAIVFENWHNKNVSTHIFVTMLVTKYVSIHSSVNVAGRGTM